VDSGVYLQGKLCVQTYSLSNIQNGVLKDLIIGSAETLCVHFSDLFIFFSFQFFFFPPLHLSHIMCLLKTLDLYGMLYFVYRTVCKIQCNWKICIPGTDMLLHLAYFMYVVLSTCLLKQTSTIKSFLNSSQLGAMTLTI